MSQYHRTQNKQVAVKPPVEATATMKKVGGLSLIDEKLTLLELEVVFDSENYEAGDKLFVHGGNARNQVWYSAIYTVDGVEFILVPEDFVYLASTEA